MCLILVASIDKSHTRRFSPLKNNLWLIAIARKIFNRSESIPMPDTSPTGAKNVIVSSAENHRFASCGAVRPGFDPDKIIKAQFFCVVTGRPPIRDETALLQFLRRAEVETMALDVELE